MIKISRLFIVAASVAILGATFAPLPALAQAGEPGKNVGKGAIAKLLDSASLKPAYQIITNDENKRFHRFFLSFVNVGLVAVLILSSFATVLRLNIDSYTIKRVLPGLVTGFILANMSLYICQLILQFSESLYTTLKTLGGGAGVGSVMLEHFQTAVVGIVAFFAVSFFVSGPGVILGAIAAIAFISLPIIILFLLLFVFLVRNFVIQFLVGVSPLAFLVIGLPFAQSWFQRWWKQFTLWAFLKPLAFVFMVLGAVILETGVGGHIFGFIVGVAVMIMAITVPFRAGGWINATVARYANRGLSLGGSGVAGAGKGLSAASEAMQRRGWVGAGFVGALGAGLSGVPKYKTVIEAQMEKRKKQEEARQTAAAYATLGDTRAEDALFDEGVAEKAKLIDKNSTDKQFADGLRNAKSVEEVVAYNNAIYDSKRSHKVYEDLFKDSAFMSKYDTSEFDTERDKNGNTVIKNTQRNRALMQLQMEGGTHVNGATRRTRHSQRHASRRAKVAKSNGYAHEGEVYDEKGNIRDTNEINSRASGNLGGDARTFARTANPDDWVDKNGNGFSEAWLKQANEGSVVADMVADNQALAGINSYAVDGLRDTTKLTSVSAANSALEAAKKAGTAAPAAVAQILTAADRAAADQLAKARALPAGPGKVVAMRRAAAAIRSVNAVRASVTPTTSPEQAMAALTREARAERRLQVEDQLRTQAQTLSQADRDALLARIFR